MKFQTREYQSRDFETIRKLYRKHRNVLYVLPTGGGKTVVAGMIAQALREKGRRVLFLVHRRELVIQAHNTLQKAGLADDVGVIASGFRSTPWAPIQIAMVPSLARREHVDFKPDFVFIDEAHHIRAKSWETVINRYPKARTLLMTATPIRLDGKGLGTHADVMHCGPTISDLIEMDYLAPTRALCVPIGFRGSELKKLGGDYNKKDLDKRITPKIVGDSVQAFMKYIPDRRTIMFAVNQRHARETADAMRANGINAVYIGDDTPYYDRSHAIEGFEKGHVQVLCNVSLVDEGFDVPACDAVMDVARTASLTRFKQRAGRAMRYMPDKTAVFMDLVGNVYEHGLPSDTVAWSLDMDVKGKGKGTSNYRGKGMKSCQNCLSVFNPRHKQCPYCGHVHDGRPVEEVDVDLIEMTSSEAIKTKGQQKKSRSAKWEIGRLNAECRALVAENRVTEAREKMCAFGKEKGYHPRWARIMFSTIHNG